MRSSLRAFVAVLTVLAIPFSSIAPVLAATPAAGRLEGKILAAEGGPVQGAVILVRSHADLTEHASAPTGADGDYLLGGLPAGDYEIAVKTDKGLYLGARSLKVSAMASQTYSFRIEDRPRAEIESLVRDEDDEDDEGESQAPKKKKRRIGAAWWDNPLVVVAAGLAFIIGTGAVIEAVDDEDDDEDDDGSPN